MWYNSHCIWTQEAIFSRKFTTVPLKDKMVEAYKDKDST